MSEGQGENTGQQSGQQNPGQQGQNAQEPPEWYTKPPSWLTQAQQGTQGQQGSTGQQQQGGNTGGNNDIVTALQALPEQVARSVREAIGPAQQQQQQQGGNTGGTGEQQQQGTGEREPGKRTYKSFGHRWFGLDSE